MDGLICKHDNIPPCPECIAEQRAAVPPPRIRVLRLLEYTYCTVQEMQRDMARWAVQGTFVNQDNRRPGSPPTMTLKSVVLPLEVLVSEIPRGGGNDAPGPMTDEMRRAFESIQQPMAVTRLERSNWDNDAVIEKIRKLEALTYEEGREVMRAFLNDPNLVGIMIDNWADAGDVHFFDRIHELQIYFGLLRRMGAEARESANAP